MNDDDNDPPEPKVSSYKVSGWISRSETANPVDGQDGIGTIYIGVFAECRLDAEVTGSGFVFDADLSVAGVTESFTVENLRSGTHYLGLFLDDNNDADTELPLPGPGDLVYAPTGVGDGVLDCVEINIDAADVSDIAIEISGVAPPR